MKRLTALVLLALLVVVGGIGSRSAQAAQQPIVTSPEALTAPSADDAETIARRYIRDNTAALGLVAADVDGFVVSGQSVSRQNGLTFIYLNQILGGIEVHNAIVNFGILPDGRVLHVGNRAVGNLASRSNTATPVLSPEEAVVRAAESLGLAAPSALTLLENRGGVARAVLLSDGGISQEAIPVKLVYQPLADGSVRLAWDLSIYELSSLHHWHARVDALTGELLDQTDWVDHEGPTGEEGVAPPASSPDAYRVFALPAPSPIYTNPPTPADGRTLVTNPADTLASPYAWHDTNGVAGAEYTITRGNNVHAGLDLVAPNGIDAGTEPDGGPTLVFDNPIDLNQDASQYRPAAVTNLFYWNNIIHDVIYQYGFDEASGNFQANNYGRGGLGNDYVRAEAQDYSGTNNANFNTPVDGQLPRMQMYIWVPPLTATLEILAPATIAGTFRASKATFGPDLNTTGLTGNVVVGIDGAGGDPEDACEPLTNGAAVAGKIALVNRGTCTFPVKVKNAQNAGAIGVLIGNYLESPPGTLTGTDATITIPSVHIFQNDANNIRAALTGGQTVSVNIRDANLAIPVRDSDLDATVIIHEYGHGVSNRLTGGPATVSCLNNEEQMGEGWSDFYGISFTADADDTPQQRRGMSPYLTFEQANGFGIRPAPYTTDFAINSYSYANRNDIQISVPHGVGFIWTSMLWDMYWNLRTDLGYNPDLYNGTGGNNVAIQLVTDGLKLQPCSPGFVDGRDAILAAATANGLTSDQVCRLIWPAFARRGLGFSASQGLSTSRSDGTPAFDMPPACGATAVTLGALDSATGPATLPIAALTLLTGVAGIMVWQHRRRR